MVVKSLLLAIVTTLIMAFPVSAAETDTRPCVSKSESNQLLENPVWEGKTKYAVETAWEVRGLGIVYDQQTNNNYITYWYPTCPDRTEIWVQYNRTTKVWNFLYWAWTPPESPLISDSPYWMS